MVAVAGTLLCEYGAQRGGGGRRRRYGLGAAAGRGEGMSTDGGTMEVMMPMPLERGERSGWRSEPGYARL